MAHGGKRCKFGVRVPFGVKQAMMSDEENGNTLWLEAMKKELECLNRWKVFRTLEKGSHHQKGANRCPTTLFLMSNLT